jgi:hypothetical protein
VVFFYKLARASKEFFFRRIEFPFAPNTNPSGSAQYGRKVRVPQDLAEIVGFLVSDLFTRPDSVRYPQ